MDLVLNIDKPPGPSSFAAVARVRRLVRISRAGHAGTLDPAASGVLLVLLGQATKAARYFEVLSKEYLATIRLGVETETDDLEGAVIGRKEVPELTTERLTDLLDSFRGEIEQIPPKYSALKKHGVPLYKLARQGRPVEPEPRRVVIHAIELLKIDGTDLEVRVKCSKGTYIRALARDIGRVLGCGGVLAGLARTSVGPFTRDQAVKLESLDLESVSAYGLKLDKALSFLPAVELSDSEAVKAGHGNPVPRSSGLADGNAFRLRHNGKLLAVGRERAGTIRTECVFSIAN